MPTPYEENLIFSIKFVKTVEKYPFIWNFNLPEHNRRDIVSDCWKAISEELSQPVSICRQRWQNVRRALKYTLTDEGKPKKKYYLLEYLDFVIPFIKLQPSLYTKDQINLNQNISNVKNAVNDQQNITATRIDEDETVEISNEESLKSNKSSSKHTTTHVQLQILNGKQNVPANNEDSGIYVQCRVRKNKAKTSEINGKQSFLCSLLPYLREMTGKQNRRFRQKVVALIDEILDDADIPQMILPPISARDSPVSSHPPGISYERHFRSVNEHKAVSICRQRWTNTRKALKYRLTNNGKPKKKYYLLEYLDFVIPFMKMQSSLYTKHQRNLNENITNVENTVNDQNITATRINEDETVEISDDESLKSNKSSSKDTTMPVQVQILNGKQNDTAHNDDSGIYVQCRVRKKKAKTAKVNGKQSFLNSLLPYLREMTGKQNRRFRQKVVALIDEILDDADIPQMILPPISARDFPVSWHPPGISYERHFRSVNEHKAGDLGQLN